MTPVTRRDETPFGAESQARSRRPALQAESWSLCARDDAAYSKKSERLVVRGFDGCTWGGWAAQAEPQRSRRAYQDSERRRRSHVWTAAPGESERPEAAKGAEVGALLAPKGQRADGRVPTGCDYIPLHHWFRRERMIRRALLLVTLAAIYIAYKRSRSNRPAPGAADHASDAQWANEGGANAPASV